MIKKLGCLYFSLLFQVVLFAQEQTKVRILIRVVSPQQSPLENATIELLRKNDSAIIKSGITDSSGYAIFHKPEKGAYFFRISRVNYRSYYSGIFEFPQSAETVRLPLVVMSPLNGTLEQVVVVAKKPFIQLLADKTIVNVESGITSAGATVLEVLEKSPGVTIDRDGNISLKGKQGVMIMIDSKPTYLPASEIAQLLGGMSASQVDVLEIMDNPPAKYDAAGNAGVINIKTRKNKQRGFHGSITSSYGQGHYYKNNNGLTLNYRRDKLNVFLNYSSNFNKSFTDLYAYRTYFENNFNNVVSILDQDNWLTNRLRNHSLRVGADYFLDKKTTIGVALSGTGIRRKGKGEATALWLNASGNTDSVVNTESANNNKFGNAGINVNFRRTFTNDRELTAAFDLINYNIRGDQFFENILHSGPGYKDAIKGNLPSAIEIMSVKADYHHNFPYNIKMDAGWKSSFVSTDNLADYYYLEANGRWTNDLGKSNHFLYNESIHALYSSAEKQLGKLSVQAGLRYEYTAYDAEQKANTARKDSMFSRKYGGLFPTLFLQYKIDSGNGLSFSAGRRIDRPAYQKLNPFVFVINKYTYQQGNPFFLPQYTWNFQISHQFRDLLITSINYSVTNNYFSQIFLSNPDGILVYSEGNLGRMRNIGLSVSSQLPVFNWWSLSMQANLYNKKIQGVVWENMETSLTQMNCNINNQIMIGKGWSAELSGVFTTREQELQEITDPTGQVMIGLARQICNNKGSLKLSLRDVFYTQAMKGDTNFEQAFEYFKLTRDTRVLSLSFSYRFGKGFKNAAKRNGGGALEEIERVGTGS
jgi:hypothetical protein